MQNRVRDAKKEDLWSLMNQGSGIPRGYIVKRRGQLAEPGRAILEAVGIDIDDPVNHVAVSTKMHWHMHTALYILSVNALLRASYELSDNKTKRHVNVVLALSFIKETIRIIDQAINQ